MSIANPDHAVVVIPDGLLLDPHAVQALLGSHVTAAYSLTSVYPLHTFRRRNKSGLLQPLHGGDGVVRTAAGPLARLDLPRLAREAGTAARARWHAWQNLVAVNTPRARDWSSYLAQHQQDAHALSLAEARRRFEAQPRVLTMLAVNATRALPFTLDPSELDAYQAGEMVYCTLAWQQAIVGQALVVPGGMAYRPVTPSLADRLRYLGTALDTVHALPDNHRLAALTLTR
jgi:hypothetical protein